MQSYYKNMIRAKNKNMLYNIQTKFLSANLFHISIFNTLIYNNIDFYKISHPHNRHL